MNLQLSGLSEVKISPTVVLFVRRKASSGALPKEVLRRFRIKGLKASISIASANGWSGGSSRVRLDWRMLVRSAFHLWEKVRGDFRISL